MLEYLNRFKIPSVSLPFFLKKLFEIKDSLLREVTLNVDKTEERDPDSESSRLWVFRMLNIFIFIVFRP